MATSLVAPSSVAIGVLLGCRLASTVACNCMRLLECACAVANGKELLQLQLQLKGLSLVAIGEICDKCNGGKPSNSASSPLTMRRMLNRLWRLCDRLQPVAPPAFKHCGVPGVNEKSISDNGNSLVEESILKNDNLSVTRI